MQMIAKEFLLQTAAADTEAQQEKQKFEDAEKELAVQLENKRSASECPGSGTNQQEEWRSPCPVADGNIVHSNSIVPEEMVQAMLAASTFQAQSMHPEAAAAALVQRTLAFINSKSMKAQAP